MRTFKENKKKQDSLLIVKIFDNKWDKNKSSTKANGNKYYLLSKQYSQPLALIDGLIL